MTHLRHTSELCCNKLNGLCNRNGIRLLRGTNSVFNYNSSWFSSSKGQTMSEAASRRPLTAEDQFRSPDQSIWGLERTKWHLNGCHSKNFGFPPTVSFNPCSIPIFMYMSTCQKAKINQSHYRPEVSRGFQEIKVPRLHDNSTGWS